MCITMVLGTTDTKRKHFYVTAANGFAKIIGVINVKRVSLSYTDKKTLCMDVNGLISVGGLMC
jgi:hypothetical protein